MSKEQQNPKMTHSAQYHILKYLSNLPWLFRSSGFKNMFLGLSKESMGLLNEPHLQTIERSSLACHRILLQFPRFLQQKKGGILKSPSRQKEVLQGFMLRMFCICHKQISSRRPHINYTEKSKGAFCKIYSHHRTLTWYNTWEEALSVILPKV